MPKVLQIDEVLDQKDGLAVHLAEKYCAWELMRDKRIEQWKEISEYIYATDTTVTRNSKLPWSNKTTIPKLCQIRDNLHANYMSSLFPKRDWLDWEGDTEEDEEQAKRMAIKSYMTWVVNRGEFYNEANRIVADYLDCGDCFLTADWVDTRNPDGAQNNTMGHYVGPMLRRISPYDIVFDPTAPTFLESPKIVRSFVSMGEVKEMLDRVSVTEEDSQYMDELWKYMLKIRQTAVQHDGRIAAKDRIYEVAGYDSYRNYLGSGVVEILTFYGDYYNAETGEFGRNKVIKIADRHRIISVQDNPSLLGHAPVYKVGWRVRQDSLWSMGPLENLVGMQYRIDHTENVKADLLDITAIPPLKISGYVEDFNWGPMERIYVGDNGNVEMMVPNVNVLEYNTEISVLESRMEEMAGAPKEAMGFRTPGEKTKYEVQRTENAASRIFQHKSTQLERDGFEPVLQYMLELAKRNLDQATIRVFDSEEGVASFANITAADIAGNGRIKPIAARHFAQQAEKIQNLTAFYNSSIGSDPEVRSHISSVKVAHMMQNLLDLEQYELFEPYIRISEQQEFQRLQNAGMEDVEMEMGTPAGLAEGDYDPAVDAELALDGEDPISEEEAAIFGEQ